MKRKIYIRKIHVLFLLVMFFITWRPCFLESEVIKMTSYYPAPYGGYEKLFTIGNTYLKKTGNSTSLSVNWGSNDSTGLRANGDIWLQGTEYNSTPVIYFQPDPGKSMYNAIGLKYQSGSGRSGTASRMLAVTGDIKLGTNNDSGLSYKGYVCKGAYSGQADCPSRWRVPRYVGSLRNFCKPVYYSYSASHDRNAPGRITRCGSSVEESSKYTIVFYGGTLPYGGQQYENNAANIYYANGQYITFNANWWNSYKGGSIWTFIWKWLYYKTEVLSGDLPGTMQGGFLYIPKEGNMLCCKMETINYSSRSGGGR